MKKITYKLSTELNNNPERVRRAQALTLDRSQPDWGLKGEFGLFGSSEWWENIENGVLAVFKVSGVITKVYSAGQSERGVDAIELKLAGGEEHSVGIYVNDKSDKVLFKFGVVVEILYVRDKLKAPDGAGRSNYSNMVLEMAVYQ